jgi:hypothetical protein
MIVCLLLQVRELLRGCDTVLGDVASDGELFVTDDTSNWPLTEVAGLLTGPGLLQREWDRALRLDYFKEDEELR